MMPVWFKANHSVTKKGVHSYYTCTHNFADLLSVSIQKRKIITILLVLVSCLLYSRHVRSTQKEQINNYKVVAERSLLQKRRGSCREQGPVWESIAWEFQKCLWWVTLCGRSWWLPNWEQKQTGRIFGWIIPRRVDRLMNSRKWDHDEDSTSFWWINVLV